MDDSPQFRDPSYTTLFIEDQAIMTWLLKLVIPSITEPMQLIILDKSIWDERASMY